MNDLMIPGKSAVPSYVLNPELAKKANEEAAAGISTGMPPRIKLSGKQFTLVDSNAEELPFPPAKLVAGPDGNTYLPIIVLRARKPLQKQWFAVAYNPNEEGKAPDCFSLDGERPDGASLAPQNDLCATCPHNAFGSGLDQAGNATKGKACSDSKILAVFVPGYGVRMFKIPPASLKNFGVYVKQLSVNGIPLGAAKTLVGFDLTQTYPIVQFKFGGFLPEDAMGKLALLAESPEADDIVVGMPSTPARPALPAAPATPAPAKAADTDPLGLLDTPPPAETAKPKGRGKKQEPAPPVQQAASDMDLGLEDKTSPGAEISDDQLMRDLGL